MFVVGDGSRYAVVARNRAECEGLCTVYKRLWYVCFVPSFETFGLGGMNVGVAGGVFLPSGGNAFLVSWGECSCLLAETLFFDDGITCKDGFVVFVVSKGEPGGVQLIQPKGGTSSCLRVGDNLDLMRQARHS